jgi:hypothetical protein
VLCLYYSFLPYKNNLVHFIMLCVIYSRCGHFPLRSFLKRAFDSSLKKIEWCPQHLSVAHFIFLPTKKWTVDKLTYSSKQTSTETITALVSFSIAVKNYWDNRFKGEKIYFDSRFQMCQSIVCWILCCGLEVRQNLLVKGCGKVKVFISWLQEGERYRNQV